MQNVTNYCFTILTFFAVSAKSNIYIMKNVTDHLYFVLETEKDTSSVMRNKINCLT
jgi:hypothetical protein